MDTYPYADMEGMSKWAEAVMKEYPNFNIVGECWYANEAGSAFMAEGPNKINPKETNLPTSDGFRNSPSTSHKMFDQETDPWNGLNHLYDHLSLDFLFPDPQKILTFLDNHDTDRFLQAMPDSLGSWKQAIAFLLTSRGIPQLYYGTELLMNGSKEGSDGYVRRDMPQAAFPATPSTRSQPRAAHLCRTKPGTTSRNCCTGAAAQPTRLLPKASSNISCPRTVFMSMSANSTTKKLLC